MFIGNYLVFVAACGLQFTNAAVPKAVPEDSDDTRITFPGPINDKPLTNRYGTENVTDPCEGLTYCTVKPDDYPQEMFNEMFKGKYSEPIFQPSVTILDDRQGDPDELEDCDSIMTFEPLYKVRSLKGEWLTVVQAADENFVQMVRLETCRNPGGKCFTQFKAPDNLEAMCTQTYNEWEFLVHDGKDGTKKAKAALPVCCSCHYKPKA